MYFLDSQPVDLNSPDIFEDSFDTDFRDLPSSQNTDKENTQNTQNIQNMTQIGRNATQNFTQNGPNLTQNISNSTQNGASITQIGSNLTQNISQNVPESNSKKRTIEELFGDIDDLLGENITGPKLKKYKDKREQELAMIDHILGINFEFLLLY